MRALILAGLAGAAMLAAVLVMGGMAWLWLGGYDARASSPESRLASGALRTALTRQMALAEATAETPPAPTSRSLIFGYRQYDAECAACHGTPDEPRALWARSMNPQPPDLTQTSVGWNARQLFWLICHGVKMTGMPAFGVHRTDHEIWDLTLFVRALPNMKPQDYQSLRTTYGPAPKPFSLTSNAACLTAK
jgi:mono/diheme cytochrome c family protein